MRNLLVHLLTLASRPLVALAIILSATALFHRKSSQSPVWLAPYLSGAANWKPGGEWLVDPASVDQMKAMDTLGRWKHRFEPAADRATLVKFESMDPGWMWVVWLARNLMPFLGDLCAVSILTLLVHLVLGALVCAQMGSPVARGLFVILYLANPLVIHVVSMPYYYGWQAVATLAAMLMMLSGQARRMPFFLPLLGILLLCVVIRPNTLPLAVVAALGAAYVQRKPAQWVACALFIASLAFPPKVNKPFWHTVYVGLGAYPNSHGLFLSDDSALSAVAADGGTRMTANIGGSFHDPAQRRQYDSHVRKLTMDIIRKSPLLPLRNAVMNVLMTFAWVYKPGLHYAAYIVLAFLGSGVLWWLVRARQYKALVGVVLTSGTIVAYFPPVAVYVVGGYAFLAFAMSHSLTPLLTPRPQAP